MNCFPIFFIQALFLTDACPTSVAITCIFIFFVAILTFIKKRYVKLLGLYRKFKKIKITKLLD